MISYADTTALDAWLGTTAPANAPSLLRSATIVVAAACFRDPYTDTPTGTDATVLADATCAQVAAWLANNVNPAAGGLDVRVVTEAKIGTGDVKYDSLPAAAVQEAATKLAPEAEAILLVAGLLSVPMPVGTDPCDELLHYGLDRPYPYGYRSTTRLNEIDAL